jgi:hypothetical protein
MRRQRMEHATGNGSLLDKQLDKHRRLCTVACPRGKLAFG